MKSLSEIPTKELLPLGLIFIIVSMASAVGIVMYLKSNILYAFILLTLYFSGGVRFMPWWSRVAKGFSLGIFVGVLFGVITYWCGISRSEIILRKTYLGLVNSQNSRPFRKNLCLY
jgi:hypothetical protein